MFSQLQALLTHSDIEGRQVVLVPGKACLMIILRTFGLLFVNGLYLICASHEPGRSLMVISLALRSDIFVFGFG